MTSEMEATRKSEHHDNHARSLPADLGQRSPSPKAGVPETLTGHPNKSNTLLRKKRCARGPSASEVPPDVTGWPGLASLGPPTP